MAVTVAVKKQKKDYSGIVKGWREFPEGKRYYFRSLWEINYAHYLQWLKERGDIQDWAFEADTFWFQGIKRGVCSYLPDFKIWENDSSVRYVEVKGWLDPKSATKLKRMAKYYPNVKLELVGKEQYKQLKEWGRLFGWE